MELSGSIFQNHPWTLGLWFRREVHDQRHDPRPGRVHSSVRDAEQKYSMSCVASGQDHFGKNNMVMSQNKDPDD